MGILDIAQWAGDTYNKYRDLVGGDPSTMTPTEKMLREPLRAACRYLDEGDAIYTRLARAASDYVCGPLYDEPGNSPPSGTATQTIVTVARPAIGAGCTPAGILPQTVTLDAVYSDLSIRLWITNPAGLCHNAAGRGYQLLFEGAVVGSFQEFEQYTGAPTIESIEYDATPPIVADPYTPGDPVDTPYGPVTVEPLPGGPRIRLPGLPPIDVPFDPSAPPEPDTPAPPDDPITPNPPQAPGPDGDVPFGDPPEGYEWVGAYWTVGTDLPALSRWAGTPDTPIYYAGVGSVRLRLDEGKLDAPTMIYSDRGAIYVGTRGVPVIGARVTDLYGLGLQVQGIAARVESNTETP